MEIFAAPATYYLLHGIGSQALLHVESKYRTPHLSFTSPVPPERDESAGDPWSLDWSHAPV